MYPKRRRLDGAFYRVMREGKYVNVSFTDLTQEEQRKLAEKMNEDEKIGMILHLAAVLRQIGDALDVSMCEGDEYES